MKKLIIPSFFSIMIVLALFAPIFAIATKSYKEQQIVDLVTSEDVSVKKAREFNSSFSQDASKNYSFEIVTEHYITGNVFSYKDSTIQLSKKLVSETPNVK